MESKNKVSTGAESITSEIDEIVPEENPKIEGVEIEAVADTKTEEKKEEMKNSEKEKKEVKNEKKEEIASAEPEISAAEPPFKLMGAREKKRYIKMLVYGDFGVGKTTFAGTAQDVPDMRKVINIDAEGGDKVLAERGDIDVITINSYRQLSKAYEYLQAHCYFRDNNDIDMLKKSEAYYRGKSVEEIKEPTIYNTVMLDSLTEIQKYCMYQLLGVSIESYRIDAVPTSPEWTEWGKNHEMIRLLVRKFRDLPMHVIFVCSITEVQDDYKHIYYRPAMPGKLGNEIQGFVDHVGYYTMEIGQNKEVKRVMYFHPTKTYQAKNRFSNFKGVGIIDPTMQDIFDLEVLNKSITQKEVQSV